MNKEQFISIPDGFLMIHRERHVDLSTAEQWLCSKRQRRYTSAVRMDESAALTQDTVKCPCCGYETPAYARFLSLPWHMKKWETTPKRAVREWASPQYSLTRQSELNLNPVQFPAWEVHICPRCGYMSSPAKDEGKVRLHSSGRKISLSCEAASLDELAALTKTGRWQSDTIFFPLTETLVFNFRNGHTFFKVTGADGSMVMTYDVTGVKNESWAASMLHSVLSDSRLVRRKLARLFREVYRGKLPFAAEECTPEHFISMTQFQCYPEDFYDAIPYDLGTEVLMTDLKSTAKRLLSVKRLPELYNASSLPQMKSIRRIFFSAPGLFFYSKEAEAMWRVLDDPNHFRSFLTQTSCFEVLSTLHQYPGMFRFLTDYKTVRGAGDLLRQIENDCGLVIRCAKEYCGMSPAMQAKERKKWQKHSLKELRYTDVAEISIPVPGKKEPIKDGVFWGYSFACMRTRLTYQQVGTELQNCLGTYWPRQACIVSVRRNGQYQAAIEIENGEVWQMSGVNNCDVEKGTKLYDAIV